MLSLSRHSFYAMADGVGDRGEKPPATRFEKFIIVLEI